MTNLLLAGVLLAWVLWPRLVFSVGITAAGLGVMYAAIHFLLQFITFLVKLL